MHTLSKDSVRSPRKIDAAMAALVSWKARSDAVELGVVPLEKPKTEPVADEPVRPRWSPGEAPAVNELPGEQVPAGFMF